MESKLFFIAVTVCIITHITRLVYEILKHKNKVKADKVTFMIIFTNMMLLWISWFMLCSLDIHRIQPTIPIRFGGLYSFILSFIFIANILFWRYLEEKELVKRFPGYAGYKKSTFF